MLINQLLRIRPLQPLLIGLCALLSTAATANNGDQMLGVNAMQWGRSGAIAAMPLEAGTLFVNPAGLVTIPLNKFRLDAGLGLINPRARANGEKSESRLFLVPAAAAAYRINKRLVLGIGIGGLAGIGIDIPDAFPSLPGKQSFKTKKEFMKIVPGLAYMISPQLAVGAALNIDRQGLSLNNPMLQLPMTRSLGYGAALGIIYKHSDQLQFGIAYTSQQHIKPLNWNTATGHYRITIDAPASLTTGIAWRPSSNLLLEFDIKHIRFNDTFNQPIMKTPGGNMILPFGWSNQTVYALGIEHRIDDKLTVRAGINIGQSPIGTEDVDNNIGSIAIAEKHLSIGLTRKISDRLSGSISFTSTLNKKLASSSGSGNHLEIQQNFLHAQISYQY